jgi:hypothetical protein
MQTIGIAMVVGGMALLIYGWMFRLPTQRKVISSRESFDESQARFEHYLRQVQERSQPVDTSAPVDG